MDQHTISPVLDRLFSREHQQQLYISPGTWLFVKYLNGLQFLGFFCAFFGLISCLLGMLDVVIIPAFYSDLTNRFPIQLTLENAFGFPIYIGVMTIVSGALALRTVVSQRFTSLRKFYVSLWFILLLEIVYWCCFIAAIAKGLLSRGSTSNETHTNSLLVIRVFAAVNLVITLMPCLTGLALYTTPVVSWHSGCGCCPLRATALPVDVPASATEFDPLLASQPTLSANSDQEYRVTTQPW